MAKKIITAVLTLAVLLSVCGCTAIIERDYASSAEHRQPSPSGSAPESPVVEVKNYSQLRDAVSGFVSERLERGTVRMVGYERDVESDVDAACMEIANNTPMGAYAVYYISGSVSKIVSYYEASISITYKHSAAQMSAVREVKDEDAARSVLRAALETYEPSVAMLESAGAVSESFITAYVDELYYEDPSISVTYPEVKVTAYPQNGTDRILEAEFSYTYLKTSLVTMRERLLEQALSLASAAEGYAPQEAVLYLAGSLSDSVTVVERNWDDGRDRWSTDDTAYGALVRGSAASEGFAMAVKLLCDRLGIDCVVVKGRLFSADYAWNAVEIDGEWYHIDVCRCAAEGLEAGFLKNDEAMSAEYLWDSSKYPQCSGQLTYRDVVGSEAAAVSAVASEAPPELRQTRFG